MKIVFSGGATLGPVTPLLAIADSIKTAHPDASFVWIGTASGPERDLVVKQGISFFAISAGKLRRYVSFGNFLDLFRLPLGLIQAFRLLWKESPDVCISAGGFVSVPVHMAAWFLGIPAWVHQQDVQIGLANRIMAPTARVITTALEQNVQKFSRKKTRWLGNPVRSEVTAGNHDRALSRFKLSPNLPVVFATGGGTGSMRVNQLVAEAMGHLGNQVQVIHISGKERPKQFIDHASKIFPTYHPYQFFTDEMKDAYAVADIVVSRGGFGTIAEIAALGLPAILIPKGGHQEENVLALSRAGAVLVLHEETANGYHLARLIKELLGNTAVRKRMGEKLQQLLPRAKTETILDIVHYLLSV